MRMSTFRGRTPLLFGNRKSPDILLFSIPRHAVSQQLCREHAYYANPYASAIVRLIGMSMLLPESELDQWPKPMCKQQ